MTALLTVALVVVVAAAISGATMTALRRERRSIDRHRRAMNVVSGLASVSHGEVAQAATSVDPAKSHVRKVGAHSKGAVKAKEVPLSARLPERPVVTNAPVPPNSPPQQPPQSSGRSTSPRQTIRDLIRAGMMEGVDDIEAQSDEVGVGGVLEDQPDVLHPPAPVAQQTRASVSPAVAYSRPTKSFSGQLVGAALAVVVGAGLLVFGAIKFLGGHTTSASSPPTTTSTTLATTTTTTAPPVISPVAQSAGAASFHVPVGQATYTLTVTAPCWVEQSQTPYGAISWDGIIQPGQPKVITTASPLWLRAGNSTVLKISVNSVPVSITTTPGPYNYTFTSA